MSAAPLRIAIVGAGGVGGLLGARLARAGERVVFVVRAARRRELETTGLRVATPDGDASLAQPEVTDRPGELGPVDVLFLGTKTYDLASSALSCAASVRADTVVVTLQNGVEAETIARRSLPGRRVLPGVVYVASTRTPAGGIEQNSRFFRLVFGATDGSDPPLAHALEAACRRAGIETTLAEDMVVRLWTKFVFIASVSALTCMENLRIGPLRGDRAAFAALTQAMEEAAAVGRARGVALPVDVVEHALALVAALPAEATSSMHEDLLAGRPLELEDLSGAVVRLGRDCGIATPVHCRACERISAVVDASKRRTTLSG